MARKINFNLNSDKTLEKRYGKLTIIGKEFIKLNGVKQVLCRCECGKDLYRKVSDLKSGSLKSCSIKCSRLKHKYGDKYGRLTFIKYCEFSTAPIALCLCECGNKKKIIISHAVKGRIKSCGCLRKENIKSYFHSEKLLQKQCKHCQKKFTTFNQQKVFCPEKCKRKN